MNNNFMSEWEHDIMGFRLQTVRRKKRMQYEDFEKHLIALHKERTQLYKQQRALGWVDLRPPVMRRWLKLNRISIVRECDPSFPQGKLHSDD